MNDNLSLALKVREICLQNSAQWKIRINGTVEIETYQDLPRDQGYYLFQGQVKEGELDDFQFRLEKRRPPD